jgi:hypothetical protein
VLTQAFTVISGEYDDGILVQTFFLQKAEQSSHLRIGEGNFSVIGVRGILLAVRSWRAIGKMWVV